MLVLRRARLQSLVARALSTNSPQSPSLRIPDAHGADEAPRVTALDALTNPELREKRTVLEEIVRVNQLGLSASAAFLDATAVGTNAEVSDSIQDCRSLVTAASSITHDLIADHRVRPSIGLPFASAAGLVAGGFARLLPEAVSTAVQVAVLSASTVHFNSQIREFNDADLTNKQLRAMLIGLRNQSESRLTELQQTAAPAPGQEQLNLAVKWGFSVLSTVGQKL